MVPGFYCRLFGVYLTQLETAVAGLHQQTVENIDVRMAPWTNAWTNAHGKVFDVPSADLLRYGLLLGRLAESYSSYLVAEEILNRLAESAIHRDPWIPDPAAVLITAGEFNRRRGNLDNAEGRYRQA